MANISENIAPSVSKFTSECVPVGKHGVVDLNNEHEVVDAYKAIQKFLATEVSKTGTMNFTPAQMEHAQRGRAKAKRELNELKPYINPAVFARLDVEFRELSREAQNLSEQRRVNMDKKIDEGFDEAISEFMDLAGICPDDESCEDVDFVSCFDIPCDEEPEETAEMSDDMGMELKDNDEEELDESIRDFLPKAGAFRDESGKMIGGFIGNGSKDRIEKAKKIAKAKFYNGDRMGRVSDEEIDNFDEVYADLMRRAGMEPEELGETAQPKSYLKPLNETIAGDGKFSDAELARLGVSGKKPTKKFKIYQNPMGEIVVTNHVLDRIWALMDEADIFEDIVDKILTDWEDANAVGYDQNLLKYREVRSQYPFDGSIDIDDMIWNVSKYYASLNESTSEEVGVEDFSVEEPTENPVDEIRMDVPLFMRCLEFAREDAQDDMDLHHLVEKATELSKDGKVLNMDNYDELSGGKSEEAIDESKDPNTDTKMKPVKKGVLKEGWFTKKAKEKLSNEEFDIMKNLFAKLCSDLSDEDLDRLKCDPLPVPVGLLPRRKSDLKEGCSGKRKWKRIEKKSAVSEARRCVPYKLTVK